jgi:hypothetical protein
VAIVVPETIPDSRGIGDERMTVGGWLSAFVRPIRFLSISEAIMKAILSTAVVLCGSARAADKVDPVGTWNCEYEIGGTKLSATLSIQKDGDKFIGTMSWPDQKDAKLKDVTLKDDTLTYSAVRKYMENEFPLDFSLTIDGDKFKGKATANVGGNKQVFDFEGKREKKDK